MIPYRSNSEAFYFGFKISFRFMVIKAFKGKFSFTVKVYAFVGSKLIILEFWKILKQKTKTLLLG